MLLSTRGQALGGGGDPGVSERDSCQPISAPWGGLSAELGGWDQSGFRLEMQLSTSSGAIAGSSTLTEPGETAHQAPQPRSRWKAKRSLLGAEHQMALFLERISESPQLPFFSCRPWGSPSQLHLPPTSCSSPGALEKWVRPCESPKNYFSSSLSVSRSNSTFFCLPDLAPSNSPSPSTPCPSPSLALESYLSFKTLTNHTSPQSLPRFPQQDSVCVSLLVFLYLKVNMLVCQSCLTLCDPVDHNPSLSSVHGILQARILEWVANSFSGGRDGGGFI